MSRRTTRGGGSALVALVLTLLITGCQGEPADEADDQPSTVIVSVPPEPPGIRMSFLQRRSQEGTTLAALRIINITGDALAVRDVGLEWPGYRFTRPKRTRVVAGQTVDLDVRLPPPTCTREPSEERAVGIIVTDERTVRRRIDDAGMRFLERIWRADCATRRVDRLVELDYVVPSPPAERIDLRLTRRGAESGPEVRVDSIQGSVLFDLSVDPGGGLSRAQKRATVPMRFSPGRCDEHGRSQSTQSFVFRLQLLVGADPNPIAVIAQPDRRAQAKLLKLLDASCGGVR